MRQVESRYFLIVAVVSVAGSVAVGQLLVPFLSHFSHQAVDLQHAEAAPLPLAVEDNFKIKEKVGDAA